MFKPTLKRSKLDLNIQSRSLLHSTRTTLQHEFIHNSQSFAKSPQTISLLPRKMLQENTEGFFIPKKPIVSPLSILSYKYPAQVSQLIEKKRQKTFHRGIGYYDNIFYLFLNETVVLWHYIGTQSFENASNTKNCEFDADIYGVGMGKLTNVGDIFLKNQVRILAIGFQSLIQLFQIKNQQTLQIVDLHILIKTEVSLTTQNILINNNNEIFFGGSNRTVSMMTFNQTPKKIVPMSFIQTLFRRFSPFKNSDNIQKIITYGNRVYCLIKKDKKKMSSSFSKYKYSIQKWISSKVVIPPSEKFIDIYEITLNQNFIFINSLPENQIAYKMQSNFAESKIGREHDSYEIKSIYIENKTKNLGVIFKCGLFAVIKDCINLSFWKAPDKIPSDLLNIGIDIPAENAIKNSSIFCSISESKKIIASEGFQNLTLLNDRVLYLDSHHTYIHKRNYNLGQLFQITNNYHKSQIPLLNPTKKWAIFSQKGFDIVTKPEHRDSILAFHSKLSSEQQFFQSLKGKVKLQHKIDQLAYLYGYSQFCCYLYELLITPQYKVSFNRQFQEILKTEFQDNSQKKTLDNWSVLDNYRQGHEDKIYRMNNQTLEKIYQLLIRYQSRPVPIPMQLIQKRGQTSEVSDAGWYAARFIFYRIINSIVNLHPKDFVAKKKQVQFTQVRLQKLLQILKQKQKRAAKAAKLSSMQRMFQANNSKNLDASVTTQYSRNIFRQGYSEIMDEEEGYYQPVSTSTFLLQQKLIDAIPKLLKLIEIFCYIGGDIDKQNNEFPSFAQVIYNSESRKKIKDTILKYFKGEHIKTQLWNEIQYEIPQLELSKSRAYMKWSTNKDKFRPQDIDLQKLSCLFDRQHLSQLEYYFRNAQHKFVELLLTKIKYLNIENQELISKYKTYVNGNYFQRQERKLIDQQRYKIQLDIEELKNYLIQFVGKQIDQAHQCPQISQIQKHMARLQQDNINYTKRLKLDKIVTIIHSKAEKQIKQIILHKLTAKKLFDLSKKIQDFQNVQTNKKLKQSISTNASTIRKQKILQKKKIQQLNTEQLLQLINKKQTNNTQYNTTLEQLLATVKKN